jgi:single-strand DNA-binding protein
MSLNKAMIIGNLGRDPEMRYTPNGQAVTQFTVAVNRNYKDANGEWKEETEWFRIVAWGPLAERTAEYLRKGRKVYVEGRLQTRNWEGQDGQKHYTTELIANTVTGLDPRPREDGAPEPAGARGSRGGSTASAGPGAGAGPGPGPSDDFGSSDLDELPF